MHGARATWGVPEMLLVALIHRVDLLRHQMAESKKTPPGPIPTPWDNYRPDHLPPEELEARLRDFNRRALA